MEAILDLLLFWIIELVVLTPVISSFIICAIVKWLGKD